MKGQVKNRAHPEGSLAEHITAYERYTFASRYLRGVQTRLNRPPRIQDKELYFGTGYDSRYPRSSIEQAHMYILNNTTCIEPYKW